MEKAMSNETIAEAVQAAKTRLDNMRGQVESAIFVQEQLERMMNHILVDSLGKRMTQKRSIEVQLAIKEVLASCSYRKGCEIRYERAKLLYELITKAAKQSPNEGAVSDQHWSSSG